MKQETATSIAHLAKMFMLIRYGRIKDCETQGEKDRYNERLGLVFDAYDELLNGDLRENLP